MLAQGQKCFYEKAARDKMKPAIVSKLAAEAAALYESVSLRIAEAHGRSRPISAMGSDWLDVIEWNRLLFDGLQVRCDPRARIDLGTTRRADTTGGHSTPASPFLPSHL